MATLSLLTFNTFAILNWDTPFRVSALALGTGKAQGRDCLSTRDPPTSLSPHPHRCYPLPCRCHSCTQTRSPRGGLLTLSRLPVVTHNYVPFAEQGRWYHLELMDRMLDKGILVTHYEVAGLPLIVVNTHILANYAADYARTGRPCLAPTIAVAPIGNSHEVFPSRSIGHARRRL